MQNPPCDCDICRQEDEAAREDEASAIEGAFIAAPAETRTVEQILLDASRNPDLIESTAYMSPTELAKMLTIGTEMPPASKQARNVMDLLKGQKGIDPNFRKALP